MKLKFILPSEEYKDKILKYRNKFISIGDSIDGAAGLEQSQDINEWLHRNIVNRSENTVIKGLVPAYTYIVFDEELSHNDIIGMIDIRHRLNAYLANFGGHIGYSVAPEYRNKGYAKAMLKIALEKCRELSIKEILITCDDTNIASSKVIESCGGIMEDIRPCDKDMIRRYWIHLD